MLTSIVSMSLLLALSDSPCYGGCADYRQNPCQEWPVSQSKMPFLACMFGQMCMARPDGVDSGWAEAPTPALGGQGYGQG